MSDRLSEFSSQAGLGIFNAHPYKCPDSEDVTQPVAVRIAVGNFKPTAYDDREARGTHNYDVTVQWTDPRLAQWPQGAEFPADLWVPPFCVWGTSSDRDREKMKGGWKEQGSLGFEGDEGRASGRLVMYRSFMGETVDCRSSADLREFPFDSHVQRMTCSLGANVFGSAQYVVWDVEGPNFLVNDWRHGDKPLKIHQAEEWRVSSIVWGLAQHSSPNTGAVYHDCVVQVLRRRAAGFYLVKALYPTALCALLSLSALVIPSEELANRLTVVLSVFLTVFAIQWVTTDRLPHTSFLTTLDKVIITTVLFIVAIGLVSMGMKGALRLGADADVIEKHELYQFVGFAAIFVGYTIKQAVTIARRGHRQCPSDIGLSPWEGSFWEADVDTATGEVGIPRPLPGKVQGWQQSGAGKERDEGGEGAAKGDGASAFEVNNPAR